MTADPRPLIRDRALSLGFDAVGFSRAQLPPETRRDLAGFLAAGWHGEMGWLADKADRRGDPQVLWPAARSVVVLGLNYAPAADPRALLAHRERGAISVYARNRDYHDVIKTRLRVLGRWIVDNFGCEIKLFVDTAPVMEKPLAMQAGLGWQGKHTNLVSRRFGSWLFLGEIVTALELSQDGEESDHCGRCRKCLDICPTQAIPEPYRLDARRCISYLTIEHKGPVPASLRPLIGNRVYGCDDCLAVCPWNKFAARSREAAFLPRAELTAPRLADLAQLDEAGFRQVFRGSPIKRIGRDRFVRNVATALGNCGDLRQTPVLQTLAADESALVRDAALWSLRHLGVQGGPPAPLP
ncbi:MAG: tRNA epoxyqueuosine(34) reductase QueG [Azospirillum sp.]|nr:tRNA epoxyqueuosine(34) reductase QueG [Azospirillum sp.]